MSHKSALKEVEDYDVKGVDILNPDKPIYWEEAVVNLVSFKPILVPVWNKVEQ